MRKIKIILASLAAVVLLGTLIFFIQKEIGKEVVSGDKHIYKGQTLPEDFEEPEVVELSDRASYLDTSQQLTPEAKKAVERLILDAEDDGMCLVVFDSYRTKQDQEDIREKVNSDKLQKVALPNQSEHRTGMAVDFAACPMKDGKRDDSVERLELKKDLRELPEYEWLLENANKYNFTESFRKENQDVTGFPPEPWHWKYVKSK